MALPDEVIGGDDHSPGDDSGGDNGIRMAGVQRVGSRLLPVGGDDQLPSIELGGDDKPMMAGLEVDSGLPQIFSRDVDPIVYARYMGHVRDAIRISRQGYWNSDIPSPYRVESRTARHGDAWRTRSFDKVEIEHGAVWIVSTPKCRYRW